MSVPPSDPELAALLERAKGYKMTPEELREQRITFVYGNVAFESPTITREMVEEIVMGGEERARAAFKRWLANPEFKAALHRHDHLAAPEKDYGI